MKPYTREDADRIRAILDKMLYLAVGTGDSYSACSMAAINLGLNGTLTDKTPDCMSEVIGVWVRIVNDVIPAAFRDSLEWRELLPLAAGTGREYEKERLEIVLTWMWEEVIPQFQPTADEMGFGSEWRRMTEVRTKQAAKKAYWAAGMSYWAARTAGEARVAGVARAAQAASAMCAAYSEDTTAYVEWAAWAAREASRSAHGIPDFWVRADPIGLLRRLIEVNKPKWETEE